MRLLICTQAVDRNDPVLGFFHRWIEEFALRCESVTVVCLRKGDYALPKTVEVIALGDRGRILRALEVCTIAWGRRSEYDAVFVHMNPEYLVAAGWLWRLLGKKVGLWYVHKAVNLRLHIALAFVHHIFTASKESFRLESRKVHILGHGIDAESYANVERARGDTIRLITAGRIARSKRIDHMLDATAELVRRGRSVTLDIVGATVADADRAYQRELEKKIVELGLFDVVAFTGAVPHEGLPAALADHSIFLNMSETGSVDKAVLEALAAGLPVVTSNEAFAHGIPVAYVAGGAGAVADAIIAAEATESEPLREFARERFGLAHLITRIMAFYDA